MKRLGNDLKQLLKTWPVFKGTSQSLWGDFPQILHVYMLVINGVETNCGIAHISGILLMTSYSQLQIYMYLFWQPSIIHSLSPGINLYPKQNILPLSATSNNPSRITGNNQMLLMMEELEATMQDSSRMNDVFTETNWKAVENFVIYFEKIISASIDPLTQLNKTNHPRSYFALIYMQVKLKVSVYNLW